MIGIDIKTGNLGGPLPDGWSILTSLTSLTLYSNQFTGTLPASWSTLTGLNNLFLGPDNQLSGTLPHVSVRDAFMSRLKAGGGCKGR